MRYAKLSYTLALKVKNHWLVLCPTWNTWKDKELLDYASERLYKYGEIINDDRISVTSDIPSIEAVYSFNSEYFMYISTQLQNTASRSSSAHALELRWHLETHKYLARLSTFNAVDMLLFQKSEQKLEH